MPSAVKGSKQERMVVVPYRPWKSLFFNLTLVAGAVVSALFGFAYGYYRLHIQQTVEPDRAELVEEIELLRVENFDLNRQVAILDRTSIMDQRANEEVQDTISSLRDQVALLEQDITYYRSVVSEETEDTGLIISNWDINSTREDDLYRYKLVMRQQDADGDTFLTGHVNVSLVGRQNEEFVTFPLHAVSAEQDQLDIRLRFKFFQNIEGELILPEGFVPNLVQIAAVETSPFEKTFDQDFSWVVKQ